VKAVLELSVGRGWKIFEVHARNMDIKDNSDKVSEKRDNLFGNRTVFLVIKWQSIQTVL
jgi:hypothetical protein